MFCGLVETVGVVQAKQFKAACEHFTISAKLPFDDLKIGDSIAVNGVCLTVTQIDENSFDCTAVPETLALTNLGQLSPGSQVNLERALKADGRIGGHYVQGHVDGLGEISEIKTEGAAWLLSIKIAPALSKYLVRKGYITVDGMSLTVVQADPEAFSVTLIPHTHEVTIAKNYHLGSKLNIEVDILGKYTEKLLERVSL